MRLPFADPRAARVKPRCVTHTVRGVSAGCLVIVDCIEGVAAQTKALLRLALTERIKPVMTINRLDAGGVPLYLPLPLLMWSPIKYI